MVPPNHGLACTQTSNAGPPEASVTVPLMLPPVASAGAAGAASTTAAASGGGAATPRPSRRTMPPRQRNEPAPLEMRVTSSAYGDIRRLVCFGLLGAETVRPCG